MNKMKIGIYTRVSTDGQAEVEFNSCEAQEAKINSFISSQDNMEIYKTYSDQAIAELTPTALPLWICWQIFGKAI